MTISIILIIVILLVLFVLWKIYSLQKIILRIETKIEHMLETKIGKR